MSLKKTLAFVGLVILVLVLTAQINNPTGSATVVGGTCTNKVVTALDTSAIPTCTTITSAYVDSSIAPTASPTLTTPTLGVATATTINKVTITAPASGSTLTIADGKTLTASNSITIAGTDSTTMTFPSVSATIPRTVASGTVALSSLGAIASNACHAAVTGAATGTLTTDVIEVGWNGDPTALTGYGVSGTGAVLTIYAYPTADTVNIKVCNSTAGSITPSDVTLNFRVTR